MNLEKIILKISDKINKESQIAPCLFFGKNKELLSTQVKEIAEAKMADLNANDVEAAMKIIEGSARSMGVEVK